eukprot:1279244-Pyramimonas_sp.AAC.1
MPQTAHEIYTGLRARSTRAWSAAIVLKGHSPSIFSSAHSCQCLAVSWDKTRSNTVAALPMKLSLMVILLAPPAN